MFSALDINEELIDIDTAVKQLDNQYFCTSCKGELTVKNGSVRIRHFAHKNKCNCDDYDNDMSEWHRNWQKKFPLKNREVVLKMDKDDPFYEDYRRTTHRTDVLCYGYAIEFQNSPISSDEFNERNNFYNRLGYKVVWIFNMIEQYNNDKMICYGEWSNKRDNGGKYSWSYASKTFLDYKANDKKVVLFFQVADENDYEEDKDQTYIERVIWAINYDDDLECTDFKRFCTSYYPGNFVELMKWLSTRVL